MEKKEKENKKYLAVTTNNGGDSGSKRDGCDIAAATL